MVHGHKTLRYTEFVYFVYVLRSLKDRKMYIGYSSNLKRRLKEHETGGSISTKCRLPFEYAGLGGFS